MERYVSLGALFIYHLTNIYALHLEHLLIHFDFCSGLYSKNISFDSCGTLVFGQWIIAFVDAHL